MKLQKRIANAINMPLKDDELRKICAITEQEVQKLRDIILTGRGSSAQIAAFRLKLEIGHTQIVRDINKGDYNTSQPVVIVINDPRMSSTVHTIQAQHDIKQIEQASASLNNNDKV